MVSAHRLFVSLSGLRPSTPLLRAAMWGCSQQPGIYSMKDVLGF